ncbi:glycosyltransferase family 4 protein [Arthrobacter bambusae]|uniref:glycosyltransferase family 4 protein n=1 Tax=Arthrobacter bambusae TaxID=1338426 RepID=UPI0027883A98|nr:glycosyltransferase family 4 protein [Arthrobacter bambusae]MDQ0031444.1 glycosyltransferase involved in cell wall biosynthesis [Arthrobacter bambusae]MDQ0099668.1 glycosyltransferase involved in cell wall biosynthesis [Arthrobacter bambusae]
MRVAIIHPWFPQYRKPFFDKLLELASEQGIRIDIFHGNPPPEWQERGDSVSEPYATRMNTKFFNIRGRSLVYKSPVSIWQKGPYDVVVLEQAVRNLETYQLLLRRQGAHVAFWGHGKTYTKSTGRAQEWFKQFLTRRGEWFFSYTKGGEAAVRAAGFPANRITIVQNSVDSTELRNLISKITDVSKQTFADKHDLRGKTGIFIGGLDDSKRLEFLLEAAQQVHSSDPEFRLIIAGNGSRRDLVQSAADSNPWIAYLGSLFGEEKALALASAEVLLMPGRVGLVAVDSFASTTPIVTTDWPLHAPEFEYLQPGHNAVVTRDDMKEYSTSIVELLNDTEALDGLKRGTEESAEVYSVHNMASNFLQGLTSLRKQVHVK